MNRIARNMFSKSMSRNPKKVHSSNICMQCYVEKLWNNLALKSKCEKYYTKILFFLPEIASSYHIIQLR